MKKGLKYLLLGLSCFLVILITVIIIFLNQKITVPSLADKNLTIAEKMLGDCSFKAVVEYEYSDSIRKDYVISQNIPAGDKIKRGSEIQLIVSKGKEQVVVPDVEGKPFDEAQKALLDMKFKVKKTEAFSDDFEKGLIISQSVNGGDSVDKGFELFLTVSKGPDLVTVPNIEGLSAKEAKEKLLDADLKIKTDIKCSNTVKEGLVISQDVKSGEQISRNSEILVYVSAGVSNTVGNTPSNIGNHGIVAAQGDWVYYSNMNYDYYLYKMRTDGSEKQILVNDAVIQVNVLGEWVYYTAESQGVYKIKLDGSQRTKLSPLVCRWMYVVGDWIYYKQSPYEGNIYRMKTDGSEAQQICTDSCRKANVVGEWIYYINNSDGLAYKIRTDGTDKTPLHRYLKFQDIVATDGKLFSTEVYDIQVLNTDGTGLVNYKDKNKQKSYLNACDGWLYFLEHDFSQGGEKSAFYKARYDMSEKTKILDIKFMNKANFYINVCGEWLYFQNESDNCYLYRIKTDGTNLQKMYN